MTKYRANIKELDKEQKIKLEQYCKEFDINIEFSEIKPVGQPSKIDMVAFRVRHKDYLNGHISAIQLGEEFGLSKSGIYKKFKDSKNELMTRAEYLNTQNRRLAQQKTELDIPTEYDFDDPVYKPFLEFEGFGVVEGFPEEPNQEGENLGDSSFGEWDSWDSIIE